MSTNEKDIVISAHRLSSSLRRGMLEHILRSYCDDPKTQYKSINDMVDNNASEKDYVYALCDGLKYGNWPWVIHSHTKQDISMMEDYYGDKSK